MNRILAWIFDRFSSPKSIPGNLTHEASMSFDLEDVVPFLTELEGAYRFGLDIKKLGAFTASIPLDSEQAMVVDIVDAGRRTTLAYQVFMDDIDAPDLYLFFDSEELSESVGDFMLKRAERLGM